MMAEHTRPVTFNISFGEAGFDEAAYAEIIAKKYQTDHRVIRLSDNDFLSEIEQALDAMDIPSADGVNTYVVSKAIRNAGLKVALSGIGGDELFAGYPFFKQVKSVRDLGFWIRLLKPARKAAGAIAAKLPSPKIQRIAAMIRTDDMDVASLYPHLRRIITPDHVSAFSLLDGHRQTTLERSLSPYREGMDKLPVLSRVSVCEYLGYTQNTLLKDADQMSMAVALEVREPFFDHDLVSYVLSVPDKIKYPRYAKSLLVESLHPALPHEIVHRKKQGFLFPWPVWMRKQLRQFCEARIRRFAERDFVRPGVVMDWWKRFQDGDPAIRWTEMWMMVVLEHWLEKNEVA
jgi:asparagine synthase (glutamine-hydrolysing)